MGIKAFHVKRLREGDTFTVNNLPDLIGKTVAEVDVIGATAYLTLTDWPCQRSVAPG